jgi:hypothetical protein
VNGKIPVGYRIGGTAIVCSALISSGAAEQKIAPAVARGTRMILKELQDPLMKPQRSNRYDVRIWGHIYALDFFCRLQQMDGFDELKTETKPHIQELAEAVIYQEIKSGGWNYANQMQHCCFATGPAVQALLLAKKQDIQIPDDVLHRSAAALSGSHSASGVVSYSGGKNNRDTLPGSIARAPVTVATLMLLGRGSSADLQSSIEAFHEHWKELEKRRQKTGTHAPPHGIAPYYFFYGHRYLAQAIQLLPAEKQTAQFERFEEVLLRTKQADHTWNDRVFEQSKAFGTAMAVLALSRNRTVLPEKHELPQTTDVD